uniref:Uncharacterized protein n=1 Tax=Caenorhabditis japonica TaxID=281687 RepID=A0A8R1I7S4_CAEJA
MFAPPEGVRTMRLLAATACPAFVDLNSIKEEPPVSPRHFDTDNDLDLFRAQPSSCSSSHFNFVESLQRKRKSMFRRNQSSSSLVSEKRRTFRRPSLPSIPPTIDEMSSSLGHARSRRPSLHNDWTNEHHRERSVNGVLDNRIHTIEIEPAVNYFIAIFKDIDDSVEHVGFEFHHRIYEAFEPYLRIRGLTINDVEFFLEKSSTPIPENAEARYLAGHKIFVRGYQFYAVAALFHNSSIPYQFYPLADLFTSSSIAVAVLYPSSSIP